MENVTRRLEKVPIPSSVPTQETSVQVPSPRSTPVIGNSSPSPDSPAPDQPTPDSPKSPPDPVGANERIVSQQPTSMSVAGYENLLAGPVKEYLELSQKIGGDVAAHSKLVQKAFQLVARCFDAKIARSLETKSAVVRELNMPNTIRSVSGFNCSSCIRQRAVPHRRTSPSTWLCSSPCPRRFSKFRSFARRIADPRSSITCRPSAKASPLWDGSRYRLHPPPT